MSVQALIYEDYQENKECYWNVKLLVVPRVGERLVMATAPLGIWHKVESVEHRIGGGEHRVVIVAAKQYTDAYSNEVWRSMGKGDKP